MCSSQFASLKHKANSLRCFKRKDSKAASQLACQGLVDLANALGWNPGFWRPTHWDKPSVWWHQESPSLPEQDEQVIPEHAMFNQLQEDMELTIELFL